LVVFRSIFFSLEAEYHFYFVIFLPSSSA